MKPIFLALLLVLFLAGCRNDRKNNPVNKGTEDPRIEAVETDTAKVSARLENDLENKTQPANVYPAKLQSLFTDHGGLQRWKQMKNLCFEMKGENGAETHTISLPDRRTRIESKDWTIGYDGNKVWLLKHSLGYQGNPAVYHNLMFYFYAMPFVLADNGTVSKSLGQTELDGKSYNVYMISFKNTTADSTQEDYKVYLDRKTQQMVWLAYTVKLVDQMKSDDWHYVKYDKWQEVNGLQLPEKLTWYEMKNPKSMDKKLSVKFDKVTATETVLDPSVFKKPAQAQYVD